MSKIYDVVIVGGGIGGVLTLRYALRRGLSAVLLERGSGVGGLWRSLPDWQDLQIPKEDWTLGHVPIEGEDAPSVRANIVAWVTLFGLAPSIVLDCEVTRVVRGGDTWNLDTSCGTYRGRYLVSATGAHNTPVIPDVPRRSSAIAEHHTSQLHDPTVLRHRRVVVVGGGASAQDVLDLGLSQEAARLHWVHRDVRWFTPTRKPKYEVAGLRYFGGQQALGVPESRMNTAVNAYLRDRYLRYGIADLIPRYRFDFARHHLIPGRARVLAGLSAIERHVTDVVALEGHAVVTRSGERLDCDVLVWATGFTLDLSYLGLPELTAARRPLDVARATYGLTLARNYPNLFLLGSAVLDTNGSTTFGYAHLARAIASHVSGRPAFPRRVIARQLNYFGLVAMLAEADRVTYPPLLWRFPYAYRYWRLPERQPLPLP